MGILDKIKDIETEMARTQKNKGRPFSVTRALSMVGLQLVSSEDHLSFNRLTERRTALMVHTA